MSVDGEWKINLTTPLGQQERTLTLSANGNELTGTMGGPAGANAIQEGRVDGNAVSWSVFAPQLGANVAFSGTVDGDRMSGSAQLGMLGAAPFEGSRT